MREDGDKDGEPAKRSGCGNPLPKYVRDGIKLTVTFAAGGDVDGGDRKKNLMGAKIHEIFRRISDSDCHALGFNPEFARPDWFIMTVLPISPPPVRCVFINPFLHTLAFGVICMWYNDSGTTV
jgi:DNA-directed RNA polymerase II subunit RPB1